MKIGVTGGSGFIGQHLLREYCQEHEFVVITSGKSEKELVQSSNISYVCSDYSEESMLSAFAGCDCIVHLGAKRSNKDSEAAFHNYEDNIHFSERLFSAAKQLGILNVVNISSTAVYDKDLSCPFSEDTMVSPLSYYGVCKRTIEMCAQMCNKRWGMHIKSLRIAQVIGAGERGGYMLAIFQERCRNNQSLDVFGYGKAGKEYIYVKDVARAIICACMASEKSGVYNIGTGCFTSNVELAEAFCKVFDNQAGYRLLTDKKELVYDYRMDVSRAKTELGFETAYDLISAIVDLKKETDAQMGV